jgi:hypothetical protein
MIRTLLAAALILTGCAADIDPTAIPEPRKLDCNLIFPAPSPDTLAP